MKKRIFRNTLSKFEDLAYAWGQERREMHEYYENEGCCGGYAHDLCKAQRWEWYEQEYEELSDILYYKQGYSGQYLCKVWDRNEERGYREYFYDIEFEYEYC